MIVTSHPLSLPSCLVISFPTQFSGSRNPFSVSFRQERRYRCGNQATCCGKVHALPRCPVVLGWPACGSRRSAGLLENCEQAVYARSEATLCYTLCWARCQLQRTGFVLRAASYRGLAFVLSLYVSLPVFRVICLLPFFTRALSPWFLTYCRILICSRSDRYSSHRYA